jgi:putative transcriptional regulator
MPASRPVPCVKRALHGRNVDNRVRELRTAAGLRQEDLARRVRVSRQTIISIESGRYNPSLELAWKLSRALGAPIEELFLFGEDD